MTQDNDPRLARLRAAMTAIDTLQARVEELERERTEPIAVVGMACRFPQAPDISRFWQMLCDRGDGMSAVPRSRWDHRDYYHEDRDEPGKTYAKRGGFLEGVEDFDPHFFRISPREAEAMDPQQRLFLEVSWEALEDAGQTLEELRGSRTGVFAGVLNNEYLGVYTGHDPARLDAYSPTGNTLNAIAGRLSYFLGAHGPSMAVDTACSSSLVSVHLACQSLRLRETDLVVAGGVSLMLSPLGAVAMARTGALSPDSMCKAFARDADGFARGEGCGVVVLKRLGDARAAGDRILAVVRGSAVNQDGASSGLTVPNGRAQAMVVREALLRAGVDAADVGYVEAHGTGTALGDPIEVRALGEVFGAAGRSEALRLGSVKTNIGHLESAAGIAGFIKATLMLGHGRYAPQRLRGEVNPVLELETIPAQVVTEAEPWVVPEGKTRIAGVSAFSLTGTNAHVVLEGVAPAPPPSGAVFSGSGEPEPPPVVLPLSARDPNALIAAAQRLASHLEGGASTADVAYTLAHRRTHHRHRLTTVTADRREAIDTLRAFAAGESRPELITGQTEPGRRPHIAFVFSGHGGQWSSMGRSLCEVPRLAAAMNDCERVFEHHLGHSVRETLLSDDPAVLADVARAQPAIFTIQVCLARGLMELGVEPRSIAGHSMGEVAAAHIAGALSLDDAALVIALRASLLGQVRGDGGMVLAALDPAAAAAAVERGPEGLAVAVFASPQAVGISGPIPALASLKTRLYERGVWCRSVETDVAFHGPQMDPLVEPLVQGVAKVRPLVPTRNLYSTVRGEQVRQSLLDASYWGENLRRPVRLHEVGEQMARDGVNTIVEIGPHPIVLGSLRETYEAASREAVFVPSMRRDQMASAAVTQCSAAVFCAGGQVDWDTLCPPGRCTSLPSYPWQRERLWPAQNPWSAPRLLFKTQWVPVAGRPREADAPRGRSAIVIGGTRDRRDAMAAALSSRGIAATVPPGHDALAQLERGSPDSVAVTDVVDLDAWETGNDGVIARRTCALFESVLGAVQQLSTWGGEAPRLWLVARHGIANSENVEVDLGAAPLLGLCKVIEHELPDLRGTVLDLEPATSIDRAVDLIADDGPDLTVILRDGAALCPRLVGCEPAVTPTLRYALDGGTTVISGGVTGLGLRTAEWLVERGSRSVALLSRRPPDERAERRIARLRERGAEVSCKQVDVTDLPALSRALDELRGQGQAIVGVVHSAGVMEAAALPDVSAQQVRAVFGPKVEGGWNLHTATLGDELQFFILYSSLVSQLGAPGQAAYVGANAFLDALACHHRRVTGRAGWAVGWAPWRDEDLVTREETQELRRLTGAFTELVINAEQAFPALERGMAGPDPQFAVMPFDVTQWLSAYPAASDSSFLSALATANPRRESAQGAGLRRVVRDKVTDGAAQAEVEGYLRRETARLLKCDPARIETDAPVSSLGFDSIMGLELRRLLERDFSVKLRATLIYEHPTLEHIAREIVRMIRGADVRAPHDGPSNAPLAPPMQGAHVARDREIDELSDAEAAELLERELGTIERGLL